MMVDGGKLRAAVKQRILDDANTMNNNFSVLDQSLAKVMSKNKECNTKIYNQDDMKRAGCTDNTTMGQCKKALYKDCLLPAFLPFQKTYKDFMSFQNIAKTDLENLRIASMNYYE